MLGDLWEFIKSLVSTVVGYVIDVFVWFFEFVFWVFESIFRFFWDMASSLAMAALEEVAALMPSGLVGVITDSYEWLQYINEWIPIVYAISLFVAHYGIAIGLYVMRIVLSFFPIGRI